MIYKDKKLSFKRLKHSFKYAFKGVGHAFKYEQNFFIHILMAVLAIILGVVLKISKIEWLVLIIIIGLVLAFELINTALESLVDLVTKEYNELAKVTKDTAASAVLVLAIMSVIIGIIIFVPKIIELF